MAGKYYGDNSVVDSIQDIECRLKAIYTKEIEGILIRSRAEWLEEGERFTRYFFFQIVFLCTEKSHVINL